MRTPFSDQTDQLLRRILSEARQAAAPYVVALDGRSGAGKSTLAKQLAERLGAGVLEGDDFFAGGEAVHTASPAALAQICIDWRAQRAVLSELRAARPATYHAYDWDAFDGSQCADATHVEPAPIILFEGVYTARPELRDLLDLTVFLDIPEDERMRRLLGREGEITAWEHQWHGAEDWYFAEAAPPECFDVVLREIINGT